MRYFLTGVIFSIIFCFIQFDGVCGSTPNFHLNDSLFFKKGHIYINDIHIHHWMIGLLLLILLIPIQYYYNKNIISFILGFSIILVNHGLSYDDCFDLK